MDVTEVSDWAIRKSFPRRGSRLFVFATHALHSFSSQDEEEDIRLEINMLKKVGVYSSGGAPRWPKANRSKNKPCALVFFTVLLSSEHRHLLRRVREENGAG